MRTATGDAEEIESEKAKSTLQLLFKASRLLNERAIAHARTTMSDRIRVAHTTLLPHIDLDGTRLTDLAARVGTSKQAVGELVDELEEMGLLERAADPSDARAKLVRFSKRGRAGILEGLGLLRRMEAEIESRIGATKMRTLHASLTAIVAAETDRPAATPAKRKRRR